MVVSVRRRVIKAKLTYSSRTVAATWPDMLPEGSLGGAVSKAGSGALGEGGEDVSSISTMTSLRQA